MLEIAAGARHAGEKRAAAVIPEFAEGKYP